MIPGCRMDFSFIQFHFNPLKKGGESKMGHGDWIPFIAPSSRSGFRTIANRLVTIFHYLDLGEEANVAWVVDVFPGWLQLEVDNVSRILHWCYRVEFDEFRLPNARLRKGKGVEIGELRFPTQSGIGWIVVNGQILPV